MIEIEEKNPPQHFNLTPQELLQRISNLPKLKLGWGDLIFLKGLLEHHVKSDMELETKGDHIRITLYQPNKADINLFNKTPQ